MLTVIPFIIVFSIYGSDFTGKVPIWFQFVVPLCYFFYRILDEMDGK